MANAAEREKIDKEVRRVLKKIGVTPENMASLGDIVRGQLDRQKKEKMGRMLTSLALACGLAEWWYNMVTPEPSFLVGSALLLGVALSVLFAAWEYVSLGLWGKIVSFVFALVLFGAGDCWWHVQLVAARLAKGQREQARQQAETYQLLTSHMEASSGEDAEMSVFSYVNGGPNSIVVTKIYGTPKTLIGGRSIIFTASVFQMLMNGETRLIGPGGDGQSDPFLSRLLRNVKLSCADLTMVIEYHLESQPSALQRKPMRFVTRWTPKGVTWLKEDVQSSHDFCNDMAFQAPFGSSF